MPTSPIPMDSVARHEMTEPAVNGRLDDGHWVDGADEEVNGAPNGVSASATLNGTVNGTA